jgi:hypothetical protein
MEQSRGTHNVSYQTPQIYKYPTKKIYPSQPHVTAVNHFSDDNVMQFMGTKGYGITVTFRQDRFPTDIKHYLHRENIKPGDNMAKAMRYENPIAGVRQVKATKMSKPYTKNIVFSVKWTHKYIWC